MALLKKTNSMKARQEKKLRERLMSFLQELHIQDLLIREKICDDILKDFAIFLREIPYQKNIKIVKDIALNYFSRALANHYQLDIHDHELLSGARAQFLSKISNADFLFQPDAAATQMFNFTSSAPAESPLEMPEQKVQFLFGSPSLQELPSA